MKTFLEMILEAGYPENEIFHWNSDLYVFVTPLTDRIVEKWCEERGYSSYWHFPIFRDQVTGRLMYDCIFQYYDWRK